MVDHLDDLSLDQVIKLLNTLTMTLVRTRARLHDYNKRITELEGRPSSHYGCSCTVNRVDDRCKLL